MRLEVKAAVPTIFLADHDDKVISIPNEVLSSSLFMVISRAVSDSKSGGQEKTCNMISVILTLGLLFYAKDNLAAINAGNPSQNLALFFDSLRKRLEPRKFQIINDYCPFTLHN